MNFIKNHINLISLTEPSEPRIIMKKKVLNITKIIQTPNAILQKFGWKVFEEVSKELDTGHRVELSFEGLNNLTSSFCNASIGKLYTHYEKDLDQIMTITGVNDEYWQKRIDEARSLALNPKAAEAFDSLIEKLFD